MKDKKKLKRRIVLVVVLCFGAYLLHALYYMYNTGSRSGRVIDADTGMPIADAVVHYTWRTPGFLGVAGPEIAALYETVTDKDGKYYIPNHFYKTHFFTQGIKPEDVVIYKDGYSAYKAFYWKNNTKVGRTFIGFRRGQKYRKKNNLVKLPPWKEGESHYEHYGWINSVMPKEKLLSKELEKEEKRGHEERLLIYKKPKEEKRRNRKERNKK